MIKKTVSLIMAFCFIISVIPATGAFASSGASVLLMDSEDAVGVIKAYDVQYYYGDLDLNGEITVKDSRLMNKYLLGTDSSLSRLTVDMNCDGEVTVKDSKLMKQVLLTFTEPLPAEYTSASLSYNADENAACVKVVLPGDGDAFFDLSFPEGTAFVAVVWKGSAKGEMTAIDSLDCMNSADASVETVNGSDYNGLIATVPSSEAGVFTAAEVRFDSAPYENEEIFIDSVIYAPDAVSAMAAVEERLTARASEEKEEFKYIEVNFDSADKLSLITASNHTTSAYIPSYNAMRFTVTGASGDPWALVNLEDYNISADEYKYIVLNDMMPATSNVSTPEGEIFYSAGEITQPTATYSNIYSHFRDGEFHSTIFELSNAQFWTGKVHSLRLDYYCSCSLTDTICVRSIIFCNSYEAAQAISTNKQTLVKDTKETFNYGIYHNGEDQLSYRFYVPYGYDSSTEYPLLMLLHGTGPEGYDATYHLTFFQHLFNDLYDPCYGAIVFVPQCIKGCRWVETPWADGNYSIDNTPESRPMKAAISVLNNFRSEYSVDLDRVCVSGYSMGGFGTWDCLARHSELFSAGVPICGGGDPSYADILKEIPIKTFHGVGDTSVPYIATKGMYEAITAAGGTKITFTTYGEGHLIWDGVFDMDNVYSWLLAQRLSDRK